jgi:hypothetical protein
VIENLNSVVVTKEDLARVLIESDKRHNEGSAEDGDAIYIIVSLFSKQPEKVQAIFHRLAALAKIVDKKDARGFTLLSKKNGAVLTKQELVEAAAVFPLSENDGVIYFELEGFLLKALELAEVEGCC